mgnify:FL=1
MDAANGITRKYSKTLLVIFLTILSAFICRQLTKNDILPPMFVRPLGLIRSILYMGLFFAWGITLKRRIVHKMVRRYLIGIDGLILFWLIVRTLKFHILTIRFAARYMWYLYYLPMLFIPMCGVIIALTLGKPIDWRIPKKTLILWGVTLLLFILVITNDLHQKVFVFPADQRFFEWSDKEYSYATVYYIVMSWQITCALLALFLMLRKCRIPRTHRLMIMPFIPSALAIVYVFAYWNRYDWFMTLFGDLTVTQSILYALTFEICIQCRLIASNMRYDELFRAVIGCSAQITDNDYNVRYAALDAEPFSIETLVSSEKTPILLPDHRLLYNISINGGHAIWTEDVSELIKRGAETREVKAELEERNSLLRYEYTRDKKRRKIEEENRLYDMLRSVTQQQIDKIAVRVDEYQASDKNSDEARRILARIAVLCGFIKRRRHLALLNYRNYDIPAAEMENAFGETIRALGLLSVRGTYFVDAVMLNGGAAALAYDFFEDCVEETVGELEAVNVRLARPRGLLRITVSLDTRRDLSVIKRKYPLAQIDTDDGEQTLILPLESDGGEE